MNFIEHLNEISESLVKLDEKIGFRRLLGYATVILIIVGLFNFKTIVREGIEVVNEINNQIHSEQMEKRDELFAELNPILQEFRATLNADRILYFEYHNSKENFVGIPFKYIDLVMQNLKYGVTSVPKYTMSDINVGAISSLYEDIKVGKIVYCSGPNDETFKALYPGAWEVFENSDGSKQQVFISIPGVSQPIGMIVLEWMNESIELNRREIAAVAYGGQTAFITRINGLIMSKSVNK